VLHLSGRLKRNAHIGERAGADRLVKDAVDRLVKSSGDTREAAAALLVSIGLVGVLLKDLTRTLLRKRKKTKKGWSRWRSRDD